MNQAQPTSTPARATGSPCRMSRCTLSAHRPGGGPGDQGKAAAGVRETPTAWACRGSTPWRSISSPASRARAARRCPSGYCFAGNAALLGCCDVVIGVEGTNIGMGGPAMIEGGGLGAYEPGDIGPFAVQVADGVVDLGSPMMPPRSRRSPIPRRISAASRRRGPAPIRIASGTCSRATLRVYDVRAVIETLFDTGSVLELRPGRHRHGHCPRACEGAAVGVVANDPRHLGGAIDADGADKAARFLQLCDAFGLPVLFLCDTPGFMVGPDAEATRAVRHVSRMFVTGANLSVPFATIVLRKGYGLGSQAMAGGAFKAPVFCVAWPTGEFGGMGLEGAVRLGYAQRAGGDRGCGGAQAALRGARRRVSTSGAALNVAMRSRSTTSSTPPSRGAGSAHCSPGRPATPIRRKRRPHLDTW